ncbi:hypothetical protein RJJ37_07215 [Rhizobium redzepovicii]|uniref:Uncharacterized protein n=1 Tax=Rhizobium redzepovicii TaxID=2867518 RepID=A0AAW8NXC9_9HYPH|nr:ABC-three component system middle component 5 [Rhizobium redzepovicii]MDR9759422.1 hypothetical protein [Rhizobium redzepovicii]
MLVYHPAYDIYHGAFRSLLLLEHTPSKTMPFDTMRILDLYFVFPYLIADLDFPRGAGAKGRKLAGSPSRFNTLPSPRTFLEQMKGLHTLIGTALAGLGFISGDAFKNGVIERTATLVPETLLSNASPEDLELAEYLGTKIATIPILGKTGLKARSKLMEFRYDPT